MKNSERRKFITQTCVLGAGTALSYCLPGLCETQADLNEEMMLRKTAKYHMVFASPYASEDEHFSPHMHQQLKKNIQEITQGKIYVDIQDKGKLGVGTELMAKVSRGHISAALVSVSNLSPAAPKLDILNIPFWSANNQDYLNLITSQTWQKLIIERIVKQGRIDILFHYVPGPRTASSTKTYGKTFKTPQDLQGVTFRIPSSKSLRKYYDLVGTNSVKVAWKKVAYLAKNGRIDALDPSVIGLHNGPGGLRDHIGVISAIESVHDGWVAVINQHWLNSLPLNLRLLLRDAAEKTFQQHLSKVVDITHACISDFNRRGTKIYIPTDEEKAFWIKQCGHQRPEWNAVKNRILGKTAEFHKLLDATKINNGYLMK